MGRRLDVLERRTVRVRGAVQGVGFRPFVWRLARELGLAGSVRNDAEGVAIEVEGDARALETFLARLEGDAPALARIDRIETRPAQARAARGFAIEPSRAGAAARTGIAADTAVCADCLEELFDRRDRRYRHAFINCTQCGPRYTIAAGVPYDRARTSMSEFAMCPACAVEYANPATRRFHAQPNACPRCGPRLSLCDAQGWALDEDDVVAAAVARLVRGEILAVKGLGGYHLACDARNAQAVARLRARKAREQKPFAVMAAGTASLAALAEVGDEERALLESRERPIVLLRKRSVCDAALAGVAPGFARLGAMLPCTPLQYLLFHEAAGRPAGSAWLGAPQPLALVMTSANPGGEPLVTGEGEAFVRLAGIADAYVVHDRAILARCDDSVLRAAGPRRPAFLRRARGYTPAPIRLARPGPSVLATGAFLKNAVCVTRGDEAFLSPHIGDLDNAAAVRALEEAARHLLDILGVAPALVAHDLHPDFHSTRFAVSFAGERGIPARGVQHHHAHIAAVAAEHGVQEPLLGVALDGVGLGSDGGLWGGELLRVDGGAFARLGHLRELALPGGDRAAREPWRMAAAALHALGRGAEIERRFERPAAVAVARMLAQGVQCPPTSGAGRWFDAAAGLLGVRETSAFEGQAPMLLEGLAERHGPVAPLADAWRIEGGVLDPLALLAAWVDCEDPGYGAALFHATLAAALADWVLRAAQTTGLATVALGGGCFANRLLSEALRARLEAAGLSVLEARGAPPNDGGLALGQAAVAAALAGG